MAGKVGSSPWAADMGVGAITDAHIRLWSRTRVLERPSVVSAPGKGVRHGAQTITIDVLVIPLYTFGWNHVLMGAPGDANP